ncbi:hypothetical protein AAHC03_05052 [Spirometra sp. Aus1]
MPSTALSDAPHPHQHCQSPGLPSPLPLTSRWAISCIADYSRQLALHPTNCAISKPPDSASATSLPCLPLPPAMQLHISSPFTSLTNSSSSLINDFRLRGRVTSLHGFASFLH